MLEFDPVPVDDSTIEPPEAPDGDWVAVAECSSSKNKEGRPRLVLDWTLEQALTDGNQDREGGSVTDWNTLVLYEKTHAKYRRFIQGLHKVCSAVGIEVPHVVGSWTAEDFEALREKLDGARARIRTASNLNGGRLWLSITYLPPNADMPAMAEPPAEVEKPKKKVKKG